MIALHYTGVGDSSSCLGAATGKPAQLEGGLGNKVEENFFYQIFSFCNISAKSRTIGLSVTLRDGSSVFGHSRIADGPIFVGAKPQLL